ncbi:MAG: hypothetical protein M3R29_04745 [Verrucomicrobiota bacterium]|nr:hypothetical protein [Verrucomicrobiota bacterium]
MKLFARTQIVVAVLIALARGTIFSSPLERSLSPSQQFIIYGTNTALRGAISSSAEQTKANLLALLQQRDNWKTPIVINLQFPQANLPEVPSAALRFSQTGSGLKLQLDFVVAADVNVPDLRRDLLRAILLEIIYRNQSDLVPNTVYVQPPDWLLDSLLAAESGHDRAQFTAAVGPLVAANKVMGLEEFLRQKPELLDSPARLIYRAYSFALLQLLVDGTHGHAQLTRYIDNLSRASNDPFADLKAQFPLLRGSDVERLWQKAVTKLSGAQKYQLLTFAETQRRLDEILAIKDPELHSGKTLRLEDFLTAKNSPAHTAALFRVNKNLMLLSASANPVLRPTVAEYQEIAQRIATGKRNGLAERLARLKSTRTKLAARMNEVDDYLNWFEATQLKTKSGVFVDYLRTAAKTGEQEPRRRDPLSVYLDALEEQY